MMAAAAPEPGFPYFAGFIAAVVSAVTSFFTGLWFVWRAGAKAATIEADVAQLKERAERQSEELKALIGKGDERHAANLDAIHALRETIAGRPSKEDFHRLEEQVTLARVSLGVIEKAIAGR
jgi:hypothetical protein